MSDLAAAGVEIWAGMALLGVLGFVLGKNQSDRSKGIGDTFVQ
jgi:hypothetical protein